MGEVRPPQVLTLGETMAMVAPKRAEPLATARDLSLDIAGAESNVVSHVAALGHDAAWVGAVGDDPLGHRVLDLLGARGVRTDWVHVDRQAPTGVMFKDPGSGVHYYRSRSAASRMNPRMLDGVPFALADLVHLTGITPALSQTCAALVDTLVDVVRQSPAELTFDVNFRDALWDADEAGPKLLTLAKRADTVFVGLDEAAELWNTSTPREVRDLIDRPRRVVVKDGATGATELSRERVSFVPSPEVNVVEEVGAGDAFAGGYIAAHLDGCGPRERLAAGHVRAALVLRTTSDFVDTPETSRPSGTHDA